MQSSSKEPAGNSAKKTNTKTKILKSMLPVIALSVLATMFILPTASEASRRHHWRHNRYSSTRTTTNTSPATGTGTTTTTQPASGSNTTPTNGTTTPTNTTTPTGTTTAPAPSTTSSTLPFADSLVGYWKLNGNANGALGKDNGTAFGNVTYVPGKFGQAAHFDGKSYIEIADKDYFSPSTTGEKMTVSFWFKPDTYNFTGINEGYVDFMGKTDWDNGANIEWQFRLDNETAFDGFSRSERMNFYTFNKTGGLGTGSAINKACPLGVWTHVVGEVDGTRTKLYINGKLVDSDLLSDYNIHMSNTTAPLRIGTSDKDSFLQGSISNVMIYNRALNDSEVSQLYQTDLSK